MSSTSPERMSCRVRLSRDASPSPARTGASKAVDTRRMWEEQGNEIAELGQQARAPVRSSKEGFQRLAKLQAAADGITRKCAADNTASLDQLSKLVVTFEKLCQARQQEEEEEQNKGKWLMS